nr:MAG TPA: tail protein [Caudoviricetes sp.]
MPIQIKFNKAGMPEKPTMIIVTQNGDRVGMIDNDTEIKTRDNMNSACEVSFSVHKYKNNKKYVYWNEVKNFRLLYIVEWNKYFVMKVTINESDDNTKEVSCTALQECELGQLLMHNFECNTEKDIKRDNYEPTQLYNKDNSNASLLDRIIKDKASHYTIVHVDESLRKLQRSFSFDNISIYDAFMKIAEELNCLFVFGEPGSPSSVVYGEQECINPVLYIDPDEDENIILEENAFEIFGSLTDDYALMRTISVYDLESSCKRCGYRGEFFDQCPKCGSIDVANGYGEDTTIFINRENLTKELNLDSDTGSVKNCFYLEAGDDLMTASVINASPSGSQYIYWFSDDMKADMSRTLRDKLNEYDKLNTYYRDEYIPDIPHDTIDKYNSLIAKYKIYDKTLEEVSVPIKGYSQLIKIYYDCIDFYGFLYNSLAPSVQISETSASKQAALLTSKTLSPISIEKLEYISLATANSAIVNYCKVFIDTAKYRVKVKNSSLDGLTWTGTLTVQGYYDEEETADTDKLTIMFNGDYENFIKQQIDKVLTKNKDENKGIITLFKQDEEKFSQSLRQYSYTNLQILNDSCEACLNVMIEQGASEEDSWKYTEGNLYQKLYLPMYQKKVLINEELLLRESEVAVIEGIQDENGDIIQYGLRNYIVDNRESINKELSFRDYIGDSWAELNLHIREDVWSNDNYISDGLSNKELFDNANKFIEAATKDIKKSAELNNTISTTLKNLFAMKGFEKITDYFKTGNWMRVEIDDVVYKLRLISYQLDFDNFDSISVDFSDATKKWGIINDVASVIEQSKSMATSYNSVKQQAEKSTKTTETIEGWLEDGINATTTKITSGANSDVLIDQHGILLRKWEEELSQYSPVQIKLISNIIAYTTNNWETASAAFGEFEYYNPKTKQMEIGHGLIARQLVGGVMLSDEIGIYNKKGTMTFDDKNGLNITNGTNTFTVDPNMKSLLSIQKNGVPVFSVTDDGDLSYTGSVTATKLVISGTGLNETNGNNTILISNKDTSVFALKAKDNPVFYFDTDNTLNFTGKVNASSLTLDKSVKIDIDHISGTETLLKTGSAIGSDPSETTNNGMKITKTGVLSASGSYLYNPLVLKKSDTKYSGVGSGVTPFLFAGSASKDGLNAEFIVTNDGECTANKFTTKDIWDKKANVVTSDSTSKISMKINNNYMEIYVDKELFAKIPKGFVGTV